jgi:hypothetical protein
MASTEEKIAKFSEFIKSIDDVAADPQHIKEVSTALVEAGCQSTKDLEGAAESEIRTAVASTSFPAKSLAVRAWRTMEKSAAASSAKAQPPQQQQQQQQQTQQIAVANTASQQHMLNLMGQDNSALSLANAITAHSSDKVNVADMLKKAEVPDLPFNNRVDISLFQLLKADAAAATTAGRVAFTYVDFTTKEMLPYWITPDAVGGRSTLPGSADFGLDPTSPVANLSQFTAALKSATAQPRFIRSVAQWVELWMRYAVPAIAAEQITWSIALLHLSNMIQLAEEERIAGHSVYGVILYDDLLRRTVAGRAASSDPNLVLIDVFKMVDKDLLRMTSQRLYTTLAAAGLSTAGHQPTLSSPYCTAQTSRFPQLQLQD